MFLVKQRRGISIQKDRGRTFESDLMLPGVLPSLSRVPLKLVLKQFVHLGIISQHT